VLGSKVVIFITIFKLFFGIKLIENMKTQILITLTCCLLYINANAQLNQRFDNTNYKAIYFKEACQLIANNPNLVLLDVRSPGEYADTNRSISSNIGRLNGAVNISIDSVEKHFKDIKAYKNKTILVYCSHSQRSRVVSKFLADSGFNNVYSLNGGMTEVNKTPDSEFPCKSTLYTSNLPYKLIGPDDAVAFIKNKNNVVIDVRPAEQFNSADSSEHANAGRIKNAINVPLNSMDKEMAKLDKFKDRGILVYELFTKDGMRAALKLTNAGFKNVYVLFEGFNSLLTNTASSSRLRKEIIEGTPTYKIIGVRETIDLVNQGRDLVIADMRPKEQFENKSGEKQSFYNLGHIKNAQNLTVPDLETYLKGKPKTTPILIYGAFSPVMKGMAGMLDLDISKVSKRLAAEGYTNVYLLYNGLYSIVWSSANVENCRDAAAILTDHKGLY
jgi:rhodanese-related sulfurtransferase